MRDGRDNPRQVATGQVSAGSGGLPRANGRKPSEDGFTLLAVVFLLAILTLWMSVAIPKLTRSIQRDREVETMHRGKQYIRAVQLYYRKFHAYPPTIDALVKTNDIRFLRKKYLDPMTGKDDWKPIMFGQNKAPIVMGFFGQAMATGSTLAGIGASGGNGINGLNGAGGAPGAGGSSSCASGTLGSIFGCSQDSGGTTTAQGTGTAPNGTGDSGNTASTGGTDADGNPIGGAGTGGSGGLGPAVGQTFGGAGIIGVRPGSPKLSILVYKKMNHYNEWEFDYDPAMEMMTVASGGAGLNGTPASNMSNPIGNSGFGSNSTTFGGGQTGSTPFSAGPGTQTQTNDQQQ